ncbi:hypothetical protein [Guptibacillus sedimenti]|uniref:hypothetical protein n=1 Tax=Guptibacillus sedimenti TaxID=3025680 RepID=UPI0030810FC1
MGMNNETYLDFCFIQQVTGDLAGEVDHMLKQVFEGQYLNWYLDEKVVNGAEIVVAEVKGMSEWTSEYDVTQHLERCADSKFWEVLQGYQFFVYPANRGCSSCGSR